MKAKPLPNLRDRLCSILEKTLDGLAPELGDQRPPVRIETIREEKFGDYACTVAMDQACRRLYARASPEFHDPRNFAEAICTALRKDKQALNIIESVEVAGPGFINLRLKCEALAEYLIRFSESGGPLFLLPKQNRHKIIFEFVSANPTGPLNVVSARAAALGDSCCNLLEAVGHEVTREYYVNDHGNQIELLGLSGFLRYLESQGCRLKFAEQTEGREPAYPQGAGLPFPPQAYHGEYIRDIANEVLTQKQGPELPPERLVRLKELSQRENIDDGSLDDILIAEKLEKFCAKLGSAMVKFILSRQQQSLANFRVRFDNYFKESSLHSSGEVLRAKDKLKDSLYEKDGSVFFRSMQYADDKDRVILRNDGRPTYFLADIAYHASKIQRGFTHIYNIWGPDHHGYIPRLSGAIKAMGYSGVFQVLIAQQVNLLEDGKAVRMSKRAGRLVSLSELLQEVPVDVLRYFFVMRSFEAQMDFDLSVAKDTSEKNPYYYVAYAHARIRSIFRRVQEKNLGPLSGQSLRKALAAANWKWTPQRRRLLLQVVRFTAELEAAALALEPHRMITYLYGLASLLSQFYGAKENHIIQQDPQTAGCLLALLDAVAFCLKKGLTLLGTEAPEKLLREGYGFPASPWQE